MDYRNLLPLLPVLFGVALFLAGQTFVSRLDARDAHADRIRAGARR